MLRESLAVALLSSLAAAQCPPGDLFTTSGPFLLTSGSNPVMVIPDDLDGDGNQDLVITEPGARTVAVLLGLGDGSFLPAVRYGVESGIGIGPTGLAIADLNQDTVLDLAVGNFTSNSVTVLLGQGDGTFTPGGEFDTGSFVVPTDVAAADLEGDGDIDLVVSSEANQVRVLINNGDGTFAPPVFTLIIGSVSSAELGDLNGDTIPDVAATDFTGNELAVAFGNGLGGFGTFVDYEAPVAPADVKMVDLDQDGDLDLTTAGFFGEVSIWINNGSGMFAPRTDFLALGVPKALEPADLNGDGNPDLVVATSSTNPQTSSVFFGNGDGTLGQEYTLPGGNAAEGIGIADFNNDQAPDIAIVHRVSNDLYIHLNTCVPAGGCSPADLAEPFGALNFFDLGAFLSAFNAMDPAADLAAPFGVFNFLDLSEFLTLFNQGCP